MPVLYEAVIGLEFHAQLATKTKMFCSCPVSYDARPNSQTCPICLGLPGTLPMLNRESISHALRVCLALNCTIHRRSTFARKNYFYPDLAKGYQITQFDLPIATGGYLEIPWQRGTSSISIRRAHLEEDTAKMIHAAQGSREGSKLDYNRAGIPLLEVVTEPVITEPAQARVVMQTLRDLLRHLGACNGNLEQGNLRCDANISVRPSGSTELWQAVEIKNLNSFKFLEQALTYEIHRQTSRYRQGGLIPREARHFDPETGNTIPMRIKETEEDYRYVNEPDLLPLIIAESWVDTVKTSMPELPSSMNKRFMQQYQLPESTTRLLTSSPPLAVFFERIAVHHDPVTVANWIIGPLLSLLNNASLTIDQCPITPEILADLLTVTEQAKITPNQAKQVLEEAFHTGDPINTIITSRNFTQISDPLLLQPIIDETLKANPFLVEQYREGNQRLLSYFVGSVIKATRGKANPYRVRELLVRCLDSGPGAS